MENIVLKSVRAVGAFRPKFNPAAGKIFTDELNVVGTAFWLKKEKVLITCAHVVKNFIAAPLELAGLLVVGKSGQYTQAVVDSIDYTHDLAVLKIVKDNIIITGEELDNESNDGLEIVDQYKPVSTEICYAGFPLGNQLLDKIHSPSYAEGVISIEKRNDINKKDIQISGSIIGGFSGAPVVLKDENKNIIIGIISNSPSIEAGNAGIFMAVSWEHIKAIANLSNS